MAVILLSAMTVMSVTALTVDLCYRWSLRYVAKCNPLVAAFSQSAAT